MSERPKVFVYRAPGRNEHGDPVDANGKVVRPTDNGLLVGVIDDVIFGGLSASPALARGEFSDSTGQLGIPNRQKIQLQYGDRLIIDETEYRVVSRPRWNYGSRSMNTKPDYHWVQIDGTTGGGT